MYLVTLRTKIKLLKILKGKHVVHTKVGGLESQTHPTRDRQTDKQKHESKYWVEGVGAVCQQPTGQVPPFIGAGVKPRSCCLLSSLSIWSISQQVKCQLCSGWDGAARVLMAPSKYVNSRINWNKHVWNSSLFTDVSNLQRRRDITFC